MISNTCHPFGGEGCPVTDIGKSTKNRKRSGVSLQVRAGSVRERAGNMREKWHKADTANGIRVRHAFTLMEVGR